MALEQRWKIDPNTWHIARDDDGWKLLREGSPTADSRHETRADALDAARAIATEQAEATIKLHNPDGTLERTLDRQHA